MPVDVPTVYTEPGSSGAKDDELVCVRLPVDVVDELALRTVWLSVQLKHQISVPVLRRALLLAGLAHPSRALAALRGGQAEEAVLTRRERLVPDGDDPALE